MIRPSRLGLALLLLAGLAAGAAPAPDEELKALRAKLEALKRDIARAQGSRNEAVDALKDSEQAISEANRRLTELASDQHELDGEVAALRKKQPAIERRLRKQQELAARLVYQQYTAGPGGPLRALASGLNPNDLARISVYLDYIARARKAILDALKADADALRALTQEAAKRQAKLAVIREQQGVERKRLGDERRKHAQLVARLSARIERQRREAGALQRDERRLAKLVQDLRTVLATRKPQPRAPVAQPSVAFEQLKGRLRMPVRGELVGRFGSPRSDTGLTWRGMFIRAPAGREVRAVATGRIVFADWLRGFGNLLILDHGDGFMSLYGNNEALFGRIGDSVRGGDTVATVGSSGGNPAPGLYFELRHQGKPFDPSAWLKLK